LKGTNVGLIHVSHRMREIPRARPDSVTVLRDGRHIHPSMPPHRPTANWSN